MPVYVGALDHPEGAANRLKVVAVSVNGPASYTTGGFKVTVNDVNEILHAVVSIRDNPGNKLVRYSWSGNTLTIQIFTVSASTTDGSISAAEDAAGTDESGLTLDIIVVGV